MANRDNYHIEQLLYQSKNTVHLYIRINKFAKFKTFNIILMLEDLYTGGNNQKETILKFKEHGIATLNKKIDSSDDRLLSYCLDGRMTDYSIYGCFLYSNHGIITSNHKQRMQHPDYQISLILVPYTDEVKKLPHYSLLYDSKGDMVPFEPYIPLESTTANPIALPETITKVIPIGTKIELNSNSDYTEYKDLTIANPETYYESKVIPIDDKVELVEIFPKKYLVRLTNTSIYLFSNSASDPKVNIFCQNKMFPDYFNYYITYDYGAIVIDEFLKVESGVYYFKTIKNVITMRYNSEIEAFETSGSKYNQNIYNIAHENYYNDSKINGVKIPITRSQPFTREAIEASGENYIADLIKFSSKIKEKYLSSSSFNEIPIVRKFNFLKKTRKNIITDFKSNLNLTNRKQIKKTSTITIVKSILKIYKATVKIANSANINTIPFRASLYNYLLSKYQSYINIRLTNYFIKNPKDIPLKTVYHNLETKAADLDKQFKTNITEMVVKTISIINNVYKEVIRDLYIYRKEKVSYIKNLNKMFSNEKESNEFISYIIGYMEKNKMIYVKSLFSTNEVDLVFKIALDDVTLLHTDGRSLTFPNYAKTTCVEIILKINIAELVANNYNSSVKILLSKTEMWKLYKNVIGIFGDKKAAHFYYAYTCSNGSSFYNSSTEPVMCLGNDSEFLHLAVINIDHVEIIRVINQFFRTVFTNGNPYAKITEPYFQYKPYLFNNLCDLNNMEEEKCQLPF